MAWTTPGTAVAGSVLTASFLNTNYRDNLNEVAPFFSAWTSYTPTVAQGTATNISKNVNRAKYLQIGKMVFGVADVNCTGAGQAGNTITISLPVTASNASVFVGQGQYLNTSSTPNDWIPVLSYLLSSTTISFVNASVVGTSNSYVGSFAVANGHTINTSFCYEAA